MEAPDRRSVTVIESGARSWRRELLRPSAILADWRQAGGLARRILERNLRAQYRQTLLGFAWALIPALATTLLWVFLKSQAIVTIQTPAVPYPVFVFTGMLLWQLFIDAIQAPLRIVTEAKPMLAKVRFAREALILAGVGEVLFHFVIRLLPWGIALIAFGVVPAATWPLAIGGVAALAILATALGVLITPLGLLYHDVGRAVAVSGQFWLYLTPVVYPPPNAPFAIWINELNPVSPLLVMTRHWLIADGGGSLAAFGIVTALAVVLLIVSLLLFRLAMPVVIERMSS